MVKIKNPRAKGARLEREAKKILEEQGYNVAKVKGSTKYNKDVDFFSTFDIIAIKPDSLKFIQVKANSTRGALKTVLNFAEEWGLRQIGISYEVWVKPDRKPWVVHSYTMMKLHAENEIDIVYGIEDKDGNKNERD